MNNDELIKLIETIIVEYTQDQPTVLLLDSLGYQHNDRATRTCNTHSITLQRTYEQFSGALYSVSNVYI